MTTMIIEVDGIQYDNFTGASTENRLDAVSRTFGFEATSDESKPLPFQGGEACKVFVDEDQTLAGFIELVNATYDGSTHTISIQGRSATGDLLDSSIGSLGALSGTITLKTLCERVIKHIGASIKVVDEVKPEPFNVAEDIADPEPGDNAFAFLEQYSRKRQVLLSDDADGNLVIAASSGIEIDAAIVNQKDDPSGLNNVPNGAVTYDTTGRFNLYRAISQLNPTALASTGQFDPSSIASQGDLQSARDSEIRVGRQHILISEAMSPSKDRPTWEANIRKARGRVYSCTVNGYRNETGDLWRVNRLPTILDEDASISARMLINSVAFRLDPRTGTTTTLSFLERNAYTLELTEPVTEEVGDALF